MKWFVLLLFIGKLGFSQTSTVVLPKTYKEIDLAMKTYGKIELPNIQFEKGKKRLLTSSEPQIKEISRYLAAYKNKVYIVVHSDNSMPLEESISLCEDRAIAIRDELGSNYLININLIEVKGVGQLCPISTNNTESGRQINNRVELVLQ